MSVSEQARNFCLFFMIGLFIGFLFDILRGFRKNIKLPDIFVDAQDMIYLFVIGWIYFRSVLVFNYGDLRFYIVFSSLCGIIIYALTLSESCVIIINVVFKWMILLLKAIWKLCKIPYYFVKRLMIQHKSKTKLRSDNIEKSL